MNFSEKYFLKQITKESFDAVLERAYTAISTKDMWVIHEINPQQLLAKEGFTIGATRQLLFFHPRYMVQVLQQNPRAVIEFPLKVVLLATEGYVQVQVSRPHYLHSQYPELSSLLHELEQICEAIFYEI